MTPKKVNSSTQKEYCHHLTFLGAGILVMSLFLEIEYFKKDMTAEIQCQASKKFDER